MGKLKTINMMLDDGVDEIYVNDRGGLPSRAHDTDAGIDLRTPIGGTVIAHGIHFFDTGVHVEIPEGYVGYIKSKSGLMKNYGITTDGTVDSGFTGSIGVTLVNNSDEAHIFYRGDKIAQLVIEPIETPTGKKVDGFKETERGDAGFGSTGK